MLHDLLHLLEALILLLICRIIFWPTLILSKHKKMWVKRNCNSIVNGLRVRLLFKFCLSIRICCLEPLPLIRPILEFDVQLLENKFFNGYKEGNRVTGGSHPLRFITTCDKSLLPYIICHR